MTKTLACSFGVVTMVATLLVPARTDAQNIYHSALRHSAANAATLPSSSQRRFQAPASRRGLSRGQRMVIGVVIGTAAGLAVGLPLYRYCSNEAGKNCGRIPLGFAAIGAGVGTLIGAGG